MIRLGLLAAARITPPAVVVPARRNPHIEVLGVAARTSQRAHDFADEHSIPRWYGSYQALINDPDIDAIYIATPASLHAEWTIAALEGGKHVLCEKPLAGNAADARHMVSKAAETGLVLMEAFHWRFHRFAGRMIEIFAGLERPVRIKARFDVPGVPKGNIRYQRDLGGGALMDLGCYPVHWVRTLLGDPVGIEADMDVTVDGVDDTARGKLTFADESVADISCSMIAGELAWFLHAEAANGWMRAENPLAPQEGNQLSWTIGGDNGSEEVAGPSTYEAQLEEFVAAIAGESEPTVTGRDSIGNMEVIDAMYRSAGLTPRP